MQIDRLICLTEISALKNTGRNASPDIEDDTEP